MGMLLPGFIVAVVTGLLLAFGLAAVGGGGRSFAGVARLVVLFSLGFTTWAYLAMPIFAHFGWGHWIYSWVAETVSFILAGLVIARWFLPHHRSAADEAGRLQKRREVGALELAPTVLERRRRADPRPIARPARLRRAWPRPRRFRGRWHLRPRQGR